MVGPEIQIYVCVGGENRKKQRRGVKWKGTDHFSRDKIIKKKKSRQTKVTTLWRLSSFFILTAPLPFHFFFLSLQRN